jgi:hypothetical protein
VSFEMSVGEVDNADELTSFTFLSLAAVVKWDSQGPSANAPR